MNDAPTLLDCTLRDGGYYTNWHFDDELVGAYLRACEQVGIDVVELGYVRLAATGHGRYGQLPGGFDPALAEAVSDTPPRFAVMMDAADALTGDVSAVGPRVRDRLAGLPLPVDLVRVAVRYDKAAETGALLASLRDAGFEVCLNLMQIGLASAEQVDDCLSLVSDLGTLAAVYVADSFGSMPPEQTRLLVDRFRSAVRAPVGFHAHDNQGLALTNSIAAMDAGATWLDTTMGGMGRGAGNAKTEQFLSYLAAADSDLAPLYLFVARYINPLLDEHRWGANVFYALAGRMNVHPSYVQRMEEDPVMDVGRKMRVLGDLAQAGARSYSPTLLQDVAHRA
jgi:4-hydroxy 2-oxovalerate aldolase